MCTFSWCSAITGLFFFVKHCIASCESLTAHNHDEFQQWKFIQKHDKKLIIIQQHGHAHHFYYVFFFSLDLKFISRILAVDLCNDGGVLSHQRVIRCLFSLTFIALTYFSVRPLEWVIFNFSFMDLHFETFLFNFYFLLSSFLWTLNLCVVVVKCECKTILFIETAICFNINITSINLSRVFFFSFFCFKYTWINLRKKNKKLYCSIVCFVCEMSMTEKNEREKKAEDWIGSCLSKQLLNGVYFLCNRPFCTYSCVRAYVCACMLIWVISCIHLIHSCIYFSCCCCCCWSICDHNKGKYISCSCDVIL